MTQKQFRVTIERLGLTQEDAGRLMGKHGRTGRRWALGEVEVPVPVAVLLRLLEARVITMADIQLAARRGRC